MLFPETTAVLLFFLLFFLPLLQQRDVAAINLISSSLNYFQQIKHLTTVMDRLLK